MFKHKLGLLANKDFWGRIFSGLSIASLLLNSFIPYGLTITAYAQESTAPEVQEATVISETPSPSESPSSSPLPDSTPTPTADPTPTPSPEVTPTPSPEMTPTASPEATPSNLSPPTLSTPEPSPTSDSTPDLNVSPEDLKSLSSRPKVDFSKDLQPKRPAYVPGEVIVKFKQDKLNLKGILGSVQAFAFEKKHSLDRKSEIKSLNIQVFKSKKSTEELVKELKSDPNVEYAEPNYIRPWSSTIPNDTDFSLQWGLNNTTTPTADVSAPEAWDITKGSNAVVVGVLDSGIAYNHPDLINNMWDGSGGCKDSDNNSVPGGCPNHGWDYANSDNNPLDDEGHGTHVAGIIGAEGNNSRGIAGMNWNIKLMALKVGDYRGAITSDWVKAVDFAINNDVKILNASFGGVVSSQSEIEAINRFRTAGGIFIAAAGNCGDANTFLLNGCTSQNQAIYPASYDLDNIISVAATDQNDSLASFSNYGATSVDVAAPGTNIYSTIADIAITQPLLENFDSLTAPNIPIGWLDSPSGFWGTYFFGGSIGNVLYGDVHLPYLPSADTTITTPTYDIAGSSGASIDFITACDTEYSTTSWTDYMALEVSKDNFSTLTEIYRWDEVELDWLNGDSNPAGSAVYYFQGLPIPSSYLNANFKLRFRWFANGNDNTGSIGDGCLVDNITLNKFTLGTAEKYYYEEGTSMAAPHVAGLSALIWGYKSNLTYTQVKDRILQTGDTLPDASDAAKILSGKRINAFNALSGLNNAPTTNDGSASTDEDTSIESITLSGSDVDGDTLTYSIVSNPTHGIVSISGNVATYTPNANYNGSDSFTFKASDGIADSNVSTITIAVSPVNDAPTAVDDAASVDEDATLTVAKSDLLTNDSDIDGDLLTLSSVSNPVNGTAAIDGDNIVFIPTVNYFGEGSFDYTISDSSLTDTATVTVTVNPVNDDPVLNSIGDKAVDELTNLTFIASSTDVDGGTPAYSLVDAPTSASINSSTGVFGWTPTEVQGPDDYTFAVNVSDGSGGVDTETITVSVNEVNIAPVANDSSFTVVEDTPTPITVLATDADLPANTLTYSVVTEPTNGTVSAFTGITGNTITYTPNSNYNGTDSFTFKTNDVTADSNTATVTIDVTGVNDQPELNAIGSKTVDELAPLTFTATAIDPDGPSLTYSLIDAPSGATIDSATGEFNFIPTETQGPGNYPFTVSVTDGILTDSEEITVTVNEVNVAPVADDVSVTTNEDTAKSITLVATDVDLPAQTLTYAIVSNPSHGTVSLLGNEATYTPAIDYNGADTFTFKASEGADSNTATVSITVTAVNDTPVADAQSVSTDEDIAISITLTGSDVDGNTLTYSTASNPSHGTVTLAGNIATYTPTTNYNGPDSFTFKANDGTVDSAPATVSITVNPVNDIPVANPQSVTTDEDTPVTITLSGSDVDGDTLFYSVVGNPSNGILGTVSGNLVTYTPNANYHGSDSFTFSVSDTTPSSPASFDIFGKTIFKQSYNPFEILYPELNMMDVVLPDTATVSITVNSINDSPEAANDLATVDEDTDLTIAQSVLLANDTDVDNDTLIVSTVSNPINGSVVISGSDIIFTPDLNFNGVASFDYTISDGSLTGTATVTITVNQVNDAPVANNQTVTVEEDSTSNTIILSGSDIDGDSLTYSIDTGVSHGVLGEVSGNEVTYTPAGDYTGSDAFTFKAHDGTADSTPATVSITVTPFNDPPILDPIGDKTIDELTNLAFTATATDPDSPILTYSLVNAPSGATINASTGEFSWTPTESQGWGEYTFSVVVSDGAKTDSEEITVTVNEVNIAPTSQDDSVTTNEDTSVIITLLFSDSDFPPQELTPSVVLGVSHGVLSSISDDQITYTPDSNYNGEDSFTFKTNDGSDDSNVATISITVSQVNDAPEAFADTKSVDEDGVLTASKWDFIGNDADIDGDTLSLIGVSDPVNGSVTIDGDNVIFTPTPNYNGPASFVYTVSDGSLIDSAVVSITVNPVNDSPVADDLSTIVAEDTQTTITLLGADIDGDALNYSIVDTPSNGVLGSVTGNQVSYTPGNNYFGSDSFTYKANDGSVDSNIATGTINVTSVNDAPVLDSIGNKSVNELENLSFTVTASDPDSLLTYSLTGAPPGASIEGDTGIFNFTPTEAQGPGEFALTIDVTDGVDTDSEEIVITVNEVNIAPVAEDDGVTVNEDSNIIINLKATDSDIPANDISYSIVSGVGHGVLGEISGNQLTYTPSADYNGTDSFAFKANDSAVDSNTATITIDVEAINDAPVANSDTASVDEDTSLTISNATLLANDTDVDGDSLTLSSVSNPIDGIVSIVAGDVVFTPNANYNGPASFDYTVTDGSLTSTTIVSITVNPVNDAPVANDGAVTTSQEVPVTIDLSAGDIDGDSLIYSIVTGVSDGTLGDTIGNQVTYTPNAGYTGPDSFEFKANDGISDSNTATINITVNPPPVISDEVTNTPGETNITITWSTDHPSTSRVIYDTVSHAVLDVAPNYGYANSTIEADISPKVTSHSVAITGLTAGTTYYYRVISHGSPEVVGDEKSFTTATGGGGEVAGASTTSPSSSVCTDQKPGSAPTLISITSSGLNEVTLIWTKAKDPVTYYLIAFGTKSGEMLYGNPFVGGKDTTSYTVKGLSSGARYYFRVRAGNNCMPGDFSNELSAVAYGEALTEIPEGFSPGVLGEEATTTEEVLGKEAVSPTPEISPLSQPREDKGLLGGLSRRNIIFAGIGIILLAAGYYFFIKRKRG